MKHLVKLFSIAMLCLALSACGSGKRNIALKIHSDPLGAYALLQVKYKGDENPEWIFLGPTPVVLDLSLIHISEPTRR